MSMQDIVSDFVSRVNNSIMIKRAEVVVLKSKFVSEISKKLVKLGYFLSFEEDGKYYLKVTLNLAKLAKVKRVSKPGQRTYASSEDYLPIANGFGYNLLTTSKGVLSHVECKKLKVGGEVVMQVITK